MFSFKNLILALLLVVSFSCSDDTLDENDLNQSSSNKVLDRIVDLGFSEDDVIEYPDFYLVEGDIAFPKSDTLTTILKQARTTNIVTNTVIHIYLNSNFSTINTKISNALDGAIDAYNALETSLDFERTTYQSQADITISCDNNLGTNVCGRGGFPYTNGNPYDKVLISETTLVTYGLTSYNQLLFLLAHEIGHNIGLRHTNWSQSGESTGSDGAIQIAGTPSEDDNSVMNSGTCGYSWGGFSDYDILALETMYPLPSYPFDIIAISQRNTGTNSTEVHILSGSDGFMDYNLQIGTALEETDENWNFLYGDVNNDGYNDIICIKKSNTGTTTTEVHVLNGANNFQNFILHIGTALEETDENWNFLYGDVNNDGYNDIICIKKSNTDTQSTEVHVLNGANNFQNFIIQTGTILPETDDSFDFLLK